MIEFNIGDKVQVSTESINFPGETVIIDCNPILHNLHTSPARRERGPYSSCKEDLGGHMVRNAKGRRESVLIGHLSKGNA